MRAPRGWIGPNGLGRRSHRPSPSSFASPPLLSRRRWHASCSLEGKADPAEVAVHSRSHESPLDSECAIDTECRQPSESYVQQAAERQCGILSFQTGEEAGSRLIRDFIQVLGSYSASMSIGIHSEAIDVASAQLGTLCVEYAGRVATVLQQSEGGPVRRVEALSFVLEERWAAEPWCSDLQPL